MEVRYTTTLDDYVAFCLHSWKRSSSMKWRFRLEWIILPLGILIFAALLASTRPVMAATLAAGSAVYAIIYPCIYRVRVRQAVREYVQDHDTRGVIGPITLILTNESLTERTESMQSVAKWQDMKGVEVVGDCTYIYFTGLLAAIVPRHGFEREEDYDAVREFAVAKLGKLA